MLDEIRTQITTANNKIDELSRLLGINGKVAKIEELHRKTSSPDLWKDQKEAQKLIRELKSLESVVNSWKAL